VVTICTTVSSIQKLNIPAAICILYDCRKEQRWFPYTELADSFRNRDGLCLLSGTNWVFIRTSVCFVSWEVVIDKPLKVKHCNALRVINSVLSRRWWCPYFGIYISKIYPFIVSPSHCVIHVVESVSSYRFSIYTATGKECMVSSEGILCVKRKVNLGAKCYSGRIRNSNFHLHLYRP
jgi:hypothetical protein